MAPSPKVGDLLQNATLAGEWNLDPAKSKVLLRTRHTWNLLPLTGVFEKVTAHGTVSPEGVAAGTLAIEATSIETKNAKRDKHLRSADFFDVETFPEITFVAKQIDPDGDGIKVTGDLTVRGATHAITFPASVEVAGDNEVAFDAEVPIDRRDFGLEWNFAGIAAWKNTIAVHAVFTKTT
jgi:polyisoprenoid-binding protein YceI